MMMHFYNGEVDSKQISFIPSGCKLSDIVCTYLSQESCLQSQTLVTKTISHLMKELMI